MRSQSDNPRGGIPGGVWATSARGRRAVLPRSGERNRDRRRHVSHDEAILRRAVGGRGSLAVLCEIATVTPPRTPGVPRASYDYRSRAYDVAMEAAQHST